LPKETKLYDSSKDVTLKLNDVKFWRRMVLEESRIQSACKEIWTNIKVGVFFLSLKMSLISRVVNVNLEPPFWIRVSEWLLLNANSAIFQLYHGENKLIFNEMMMRSALF
jgi:hypothetical protein